jgi:hypothetical protein
MRWNTWMLGPVAAVLLAGCGGGGRNANTAGSTPGGSETGMQGTATDTGAPGATGAVTPTDTSNKMSTGADTGMKADTGPAATGAMSDTAKKPSKKSGTRDTSAAAPK